MDYAGDVFPKHRVCPFIGLQNSWTVFKFLCSSLVFFSGGRGSNPHYPGRHEWGLGPELEQQGIHSPELPSPTFPKRFPAVSQNSACPSWLALPSQVRAFLFHLRSTVGARKGLLQGHLRTLTRSPAYPTPHTAPVHRPPFPRSRPTYPAAFGTLKHLLLAQVLMEDPPCACPGSRYGWATNKEISKSSTLMKFTF